MKKPTKKCHRKTQQNEEQDSRLKQKSYGQSPLNEKSYGPILIVPASLQQVPVLLKNLILYFNQ